MLTVPYRHRFGSCIVYYYPHFHYTIHFFELNFLTDVKNIVFLFVQPTLGNSYSSQSSQQFERKTISQPKMHQSADDSFVTVDDDDYDFVPGTPPSKKVI